MFKTRTSGLLILTLGAGFLLGGSVFGFRKGTTQAWAQGAQSSKGIPARTASVPKRVPDVGMPSASNAPGDLPERLTSVFVGLAQSVTPAVVRIETRRLEDAPQGTNLQIPEPFQDFFNIPPQGRDPSAPPREEVSGGSGFIVSPDGYILTNAHVVDGAERIIVQLTDRTSHQAELVGVDRTTDLAVVRIDGQGYPTLPFGVSDGVRVGEPVMAVGNPGYSMGGSLDYTVTTGIVSALGRPLSIIRQSLQGNPDLAGYAIENFIQTDAVINPGNSGGPLVDLRGRVVGVNSALASSDGYYQGYGFAIPADLAKHVSDDIIAHGHVIRAWMGVSVTEISSEDAEVYNLPAVEGVLVQSVTGGGPAEDAGLKVEDVITAVDGHPVADGGDLQERIAEMAPGHRTRLSVYRDGSEETLTVKLGEAPFQPEKETKAPAAETTPETLLGLQVNDLTPSLAREMGWSEATGVVVTGVTPWGPAMERGVVPGMKITEVGHVPVHDARTFRQTISGVETGTVVSLRMSTPDGTQRIVNLRAEER